MKRLYPFLLLILGSLNPEIVQAQLSFSTSSITQCYNTGTNTAYVVTSPTNAATFSWTIISPNCTGTYTNVALNGSTVNISYPCCGIFTITCTAYTATSMISSTSMTTNVTCGPSLSITSSAANGTICAGTTATLSGWSAMSYTWSPGVTSAQLIVAPTANTCYTLAGYNGVCTAYAVYCLSVQPSSSTLAVSGNSMVCAGSTTTLSASGASSYIWSPSNATGASIVVSPTVSTNYTVTDSGPVQCPGKATYMVLVTQAPTLAINSQPVSPVLTCGASATLNCMSNAQSFMWSNGTATASNNVSPITNTCYSLVATGSSGCFTTAAVCVTVLPVQLSPAGNNTVCLHASVNLSVTTPGTFSWMPGNITGSLVNVIPLTSTIYTVNGQMPNSCTGTGTISVTPDSSCAIVWPGDANSDGVVNASDVFEIGLAFNNTGTARTPTSNAWSAQFANSWSGTVSSGKNKCHADCNGDGTINSADTLAIFNNFLQTHGFRSAAAGVPDLVIQVTPYLLAPGWHKAEILLGQQSSPASQVYGLAFDVSFDASMIENNSVYVSYPASFLNAGNQNVEFRKPVFNTGKVYAATVRTNGNAVSGYGAIAEFWFKLRSDLPDNKVFHLGLSNAKKVDNTGMESPLVGGQDSAAVDNTITGLGRATTLNSFRLYPNPGTGQFTIENAGHIEATCIVYDLLGKEVLHNKFKHQFTFDLSAFEAGTYLVLVQTGDQKAYRKLLLAK